MKSRQNYLTKGWMKMEVPKGAFYFFGIEDDEIEVELWDGDLYTHFDKKFKLRAKSPNIRRFTNQDLMRECIVWFGCMHKPIVYFRIEKQLNVYKIWME